MELGFQRFGAQRRSSDARPSIADVLVGTENITDAVSKADAGLSDAAANAARKKELTSLEQACEQASARAKSGRLACQAVRSTKAASIFSTSTSAIRTFAWSSRRKQTSPRSAATRITSNFRAGHWISRFFAPTKTTSLRRRPTICRSISPAPAPTSWYLSSGHPGTTARLQTRSQLEFDRDVSLPVTLLRASELRGRYIQFGKNKPGTSA